MEFKIDFEYDEDVVKMYHDSLSTTFTNEGRTIGKSYTIEQTRNRLYESSKSKNKNGFDLFVGNSFQYPTDSPSSTVRDMDHVDYGYVTIGYADIICTLDVE